MGGKEKLRRRSFFFVLDGRRGGKSLSSETKGGCEASLRQLPKANNNNLSRGKRGRGKTAYCLRPLKREGNTLNREEIGTQEG